LSKTISTLTAVKQLIYEDMAVRRVLVIAPLAVAKNTWPDEIEKWDHIKDLRISQVLGSADERIAALKRDADIYVINRENTQWLVEQYGRYQDKKRKTGFIFTKTWPFDMVVIDELSSFKSPTSERFKMLKKARPAINRIVGLTGTPAPNGLLDLWAQIYLMDEGARLGRTVTAYRDKYFTPSSFIYQNGIRLATKYQPRPGSEDLIYKAIDDIAVSMKSEDWLDLPDRVDRVHSVKLSDKTMEGYQQLEREMILQLIEEDATIVAGSAAAVTQKLQQYAQGAVYTEEGHWEKVHDEKLEVLDEIVEAVQGKPLLVFYWYKHDLERLKARYKKAVPLKGPEDVKAWNKGEIEILLAHPASAGHGLNLQTGGHHIAWFGLTWSLELYQQANARLHRQGQTESVIVHHLVAKDTVDETIMAAIQGKALGQDALMQAVKAMIERHKG